MIDFRNGKIVAIEDDTAPVKETAELSAETKKLSESVKKELIEAITNHITDTLNEQTRRTAVIISALDNQADEIYSISTVIIEVMKEVSSLCQLLKD